MPFDLEVGEESEYARRTQVGQGKGGGLLRVSETLTSKDHKQLSYSG